jgi:PKD repeat protein
MTFTASVAPVAGNGTVIRSVSVDFGDGTTIPLGAVTGANIALHHVYQNGGLPYTVTLTATDSNGGVGTAVTTVFVQAATPLGVTLNASANIGPVTTVETFTATVTGLGNAVVVSYLWEFGNGDPPQTTTTNQITHQYAHGVVQYTAKVTVTTSNGGSASNTTVITP